MILIWEKPLSFIRAQLIINSINFYPIILKDKLAKLSNMRPKAVQPNKKGKNNILSKFKKLNRQN